MVEKLNVKAVIGIAASNQKFASKYLTLWCNTAISYNESENA